MHRLPALAVLGVLLLAGCAGRPPPAPGPSTTAEVPAPAPAPTTTPSPAPPPAAEPADPWHWSGTVEVTESILVPPWQTLRIDPGTVVRFAKLPDGDLRATPWVAQADAYIKDHDDPTGREGYRASHFSITARIVALGTAERPILFTSAQPEPEYADWNQLVLLSGSRLENVTTEYSHNGINLRGDGIVLRHVTARESLWSCIDIYGDRVEMRWIEAYHCWHSAVGFKGPGDRLLADSFTHDAQVGINCESGAAPRLERVRNAGAGIAPGCSWDGIEHDPRPADVAGGTYGGLLIYPWQG